MRTMELKELLIHTVNTGKKKCEIELAATKPGRIVGGQNLGFGDSAIWVHIMILTLIHSMLQLKNYRNVFM